ncbi:putative CoA-binding protein [Candidatus Nitrososphaera evergladensis SR1]|uniref:Putative CoA-binding protein n=1 Tax=Candidatus Nitrososphaera evergladensis SR1 TaxID=1459636 RepID=A0A075MTC4_9ARCH|nr:CoA-binding protein [Candidatus Nitrososphaera evergladensis]AIF84047.1 putative CoA-binding protein [Candidatus Nitrososphaera evergladensis SR1]
MNTDSCSDAEIREFYKLKNIAVVGMSKADGKPANYVPKYLIEQGYNVIPVNPTAPEIMGRKSYPNVSSVPDQIDIVDVFRPSDDVLPVVMDAVKKAGIKVVWMQLGIYNEQAEKLAKEKGIKVVYNRCMLEEHQRLFGD